MVEFATRECNQLLEVISTNTAEVETKAKAAVEKEAQLKVDSKQIQVSRYAACRCLWCLVQSWRCLLQIWWCKVQPLKGAQNCRYKSACCTTLSPCFGISFGHFLSSWPPQTGYLPCCMKRVAPFTYNTHPLQCTTSSVHTWCPPQVEKAEAEAALEEAIPALEEAAAALQDLRREDITEIRSFAKPHILVQKVGGEGADVWHRDFMHSGEGVMSGHEGLRGLRRLTWPNIWQCKKEQQLTMTSISSLFTSLFRVCSGLARVVRVHISCMWPVPCQICSPPMHRMQVYTSALAKLMHLSLCLQALPLSTALAHFLVWLCLQVCECVVILRSLKDVSWAGAKAMMSDSNFLKSLVEYDKDSLSEKQVRSATHAASMLVGTLLEMQRLCIFWMLTVTSPTVSHLPQTIVSNLLTNSAL